MGTDIAYHLYPADTKSELTKGYNDQQYDDNYAEFESEGFAGTVAQLSYDITFVTGVYNGLGFALDYIEGRAKKRVDSIAVPFFAEDAFLELSRKGIDDFWALLDELDEFADGDKAAVLLFKPSPSSMGSPISFDIPFFGGLGEVDTTELWLDTDLMPDFFEADIIQEDIERIARIVSVNFLTPDPFDPSNKNIIEWVIGGLVGI